MGNENDTRWSVRLDSPEELELVKRLVAILGKIDDCSAGETVLCALDDLAVKLMGPVVGPAILESYRDACRV